MIQTADELFTNYHLKSIEVMHEFYSGAVLVRARYSIGLVK